MQRSCIDVDLLVTDGCFELRFDDSREDGMFSY